MTKQRKHTELTDFVNQLRKYLGLDPLPNTENKRVIRHICTWGSQPYEGGNRKVPSMRPEY